ncbi:MAG TPA: tyrosine-type recombinase/integrase [Bacteroidales bacterium]|nr:tyrosine-type recombinase/integrase [Bacteroidales bacterium]
MAKFTIQLDRRRKLKDGLYNLVVHVNFGNDMVLVNIGKLTSQQYKHIFEDQAGDDHSISYRARCQDLKTNCERVFYKVKPFDKAKFRDMLKEREPEVPKSLALKDLFNDYVNNYDRIKLNSRLRYRTTGNILESYSPGLTVPEVTPTFLRNFEKDQLEAKLSPATIISYLIDLRRIINYYTKVKKIIPLTYEYPFGEGNYQIPKVESHKEILENKEIKAVAEMTEFNSPEEENARDIWLLAYRCNGSNYTDLLRMRWEDVRTKYLIYYRKKTESTQRTIKKPVIVPLTRKVQSLLDKLGTRDSPFVLGLLNEGYSEETIVNKSNKKRREINERLRGIEKRLGLSAPLRLDMARHCYASTLDRAGVETKKISTMLVHSSVLVTERYLAGLNTEELFKTNKHIF